VPGLLDGAVRLRLSVDETIGFYARWAPSSSYDLMVARRDSRDDPFGEATALVINDTQWDFSPAPTGDGSMLYFESYRTGAWRIHQSQRQSDWADFGPIGPASGLGGGGAYADGGPYVTPSGRALYFHTNRTGRSTLARAELDGSSFREPETFDFGALSPQAFPVASSDELTLYFTVKNGATDETAQQDIWRATRASKDEPFANPREVSEVNTGAHEAPSFVSEDGCRLYFDRVVGSPFGWNTGPENAYVAERRGGG
jgi:Tol biopolymer transport system component